MKASLSSITLGLLCTAAWLTSACGGVQLEHVHSSVQRPSNVAVYVSVENGGEPVTDLRAADFSVREDGVLLEPSETRLTLLDRDAVALHHTVVLVDLSGATQGPDPQRSALRKGVQNLVAKLRSTQGVTVLGFDGSPRLHPLGEFARGPAGPRPELDTIERFKAQDESRNLNGAVIEGLRQLDSRLMRVKRPVRVGTLIVFSQGDDLAGRVTEETLLDALAETPHRLYAVGVGGREARQLDAIGRQGVERSQDARSLPIAFEELASRLKKTWSKYYLVQYCSPARTGIRQVRFEVRHEDEEGSASTASLEYEFDATGFRGGCDPKARPAFVTPLSAPGELEAKRAEAEAAKQRRARQPAAESGSGTGQPETSTAPAGPSEHPTDQPSGADAGADASSDSGTDSGAASEETDEEIVAPPASGDYAD